MNNLKLSPVLIECIFDDRVNPSLLRIKKSHHQINCASLISEREGEGGRDNCIAGAVPQ